MEKFEEGKMLTTHPFYTVLSTDGEKVGIYVPTKAKWYIFPSLAKYNSFTKADAARRMVWAVWDSDEKRNLYLSRDERPEEVRGAYRVLHPDEPSLLELLARYGAKTRR
jgi:hypothetical protein